MNKWIIVIEQQQEIAPSFNIEWVKLFTRPFDSEYAASTRAIMLQELLNIHHDQIRIRVEQLH